MARPIQSLSLKIFNLLEMPRQPSKAGRMIVAFLFIIIISNVIAVILETIPRIGNSYKSVFATFELISVIIFTIEFILRVWVSTNDSRYAHPLFGRLKFLVSPLALIDLFAILPFYLPLIAGFDLRIIRVLRLLRMLRILKLGRYSNAMKITSSVLRKKREELLISLFVVIILLVFSSSLMFYIENDAQPDSFTSIPHTMWWAIATLTTVGYGDLYPITALGKILGAMIAILGIGIFALPAGILASGFAEAIRTSKGLRCPHCGREIS